jgi:PRC-barrel domain
MQRETRTDGFTAMEDRFAGYEVYDRDEKIGKVDDLFVDEADRVVG